jgi:hypothetical protein
MKISSEEKAMRLENWRQSGKSAWAYAKENRLNPQTFVKWTKAAAAAQPGFVQIPVPVIPPAVNAQAAHAPEILIEKGDVKIHIPMTIGDSVLRAVIESLGGAV